MNKISIPSKGSQIEITSITLGTGGFLYSDKQDYYHSLLDHYLAIGGNCIDTARHYGASENVIGSWLNKRGCRDDVVLLTKGGHPADKTPSTSRLTPRDLQQDLDESLMALGTSYVDLYALHRDDPDIPVQSIVEQLHQFVVDGKVKSVGVSNWTLERIVEANDYAATHGLTMLSFNSPGFSLARPIEARWPGCVYADPEMIGWHESTKLPLLAWSPQAGGFFSGKYSKAATANHDLYRVYASSDNWERLSRVEELAKHYHTSTSQVALSYVLEQKFPTVAIIGAREIEQLNRAIEAEQLSITREDLEWLNSNNYQIEV